MSTFDELSTPVPVSEGSQVSGEEVGPASGVVAGSNQIAATGAGNGPGGVVPVPVAAQPWDPTSPQHAVIRAAIAWRNGEEVERIGVDDLGLALIEAVDALPHIGEPAAPVAAPLEPRWGSGPLVDHNPETPAQRLMCVGCGEEHIDPEAPGTGSADPDGGRS